MTDYRKVSKEELREILTDHKNWIDSAHQKGQRADLRWADLRRANLRRANLSGANLSEADLSRANLSGANLSGADLSEADLRWADLRWADLSGADLRWVDLNWANLSKANLSRALLSRADLSGALLYMTSLVQSIFKNTIFAGTLLADIDLSNVEGLDTAKHMEPSIIGVDTIVRSKGKIPKTFLRRAGVPESFIDNIPSLISAMHPWQFYSCFISYSSKDEDFAIRLYADLQSEGVSCWFAPEEMKIGDKIYDRIDQTIRYRDKLLLVLSKRSIQSTWVEDEVNIAFEEERRRDKTVLFPIRLDNSVMKTDVAWAAKVRNRHIGDFTKWKEQDAYKKAFGRLLRDLKESK